MQGIAEQIRALVRSVTNLARRIRRLETLQAPLAVARPQGGHIIQDEGVDLTERVYLDFVGVRVDVTDDPDNGATIVTISDPEGDDFCRVTPLDVGWQINVGTESRYMKHSTAFQLSSYGNVRGDDAIDLQRLHWGGNAGADVAAAPFSAILTNEDNVIEDDCDYSVIIGTWNEIRGGSQQNFVYGYNLEVLTGSFGNTVFGGGHDLDDSTYNSILGINHDIDGAYGCFIFGEQSDILQNVNDYPTYCGSMGIFNLLEGDNWFVFQMGEELVSYGLGSTSSERTIWSLQTGFRNYLRNVAGNFQVGQSTKSYIPDADAAGNYYDGRILLSGDYEKDHPSDGTGEVGGFNQGSWFSQSDVISTWNVAWTTGRFQFPIIEDSTWLFLIYVNATEKGGVNIHGWKIEGQIKNDGGTTTILNSIVTNFYRDVVTKECQVVADDANDRLAVQFRDTNGPDATWTNVQISMFTVEVGAEV